MRIRKITQNTRDFNITDAVTDGGTDLNKDTFNGMQDNIEDGINEIYMKILSSGYDIDTIKQNGKYGIFNATGTLPDGYSTTDNNVFIECFKWSDLWCRQILYDVRTTGGIYTRILSNGTWLAWKKITTS